MTRNRRILSDEELERLSAYLDARLPRDEASRLEARLKSDKDLRRELDELRQTVRLLRSLPQVKAPRNFTLTSQVAGKPVRGWQYPVLQLGTAVATLAFLVVSGFGLLVMGGGMASAPMMPVSRDMAQEAAAPPAEQPLMGAGQAALPTQAPAPEAAAPPGAAFLEAVTLAPAETAPTAGETPAPYCDECAARASTETPPLPLEEAAQPTAPMALGASPCAECGAEATAAAGTFSSQELKAAPAAETTPVVELHRQESGGPLSSPVFWWLVLEIVLGLAVVLLAILTFRMRRRNR